MKKLLFVVSICAVMTRIISFKSELQFEPVAVVELYSSQGCSSWPPADKLLSKTIAYAKKDGKKIFAVDEEQKTRLQEIARHCPISKILENAIRVRTYVFRNGDTKKVVNYANDEITVVWKPEYCQHSTRYFTQLPKVFKPQQKKWIDANGTPSTEIIEQVKKCPSGALTFLYNNERKE